jgi:predicted ATPase
MEERMPQIISLEGAWAGGKTSIIRELQHQGIPTFHSVVPTIYHAKGENYSPRDDPREFTELFLKLKEEQYAGAIAQGGDMALFDRVFFAPIVLRRLLGLPVPGALIDIAKKAGITDVFLIEPIPLKMHKDGWPRKHFTYEESLRYHEITRDTIKELGFAPHVIEYASTMERADQILKILNIVKEGSCEVGNV